MVHDELRIRLEGGLELLEATLTRYRALLPAVRSWWWQERLRRLRPVLREVMARQDDVDRLLHWLARRGDGAGGLTLEVEDERERLARAVHRRTGTTPAQSLSRALGVLERRLRHRVHETERWRVACLALPADGALVQALTGFGARLEQVFARPFTPASPLPVTPAEWQAVAGAWPSGSAALDAAWAELDAADASGGVARALRKRARRVPRWRRRTAAHERGARGLIHAEFWRGVALARAHEHVAAHIAPLSPRPAEVLPLFGWLVHRAAGATAGPEEVGLAPGRAALVQLALVLRDGPGAGEAQVLAAAADRAPEDPDWQKLRDAVVLRIRAADTRPGAGRADVPRLAPLAELVPLLG